MISVRNLQAFSANIRNRQTRQQTDSTSSLHRRQLDRFEGMAQEFVFVRFLI